MKIRFILIAFVAGYASSFIGGTILQSSHDNGDSAGKVLRVENFIRQNLRNPSRTDITARESACQNETHCTYAVDILHGIGGSNPDVVRDIWQVNCDWSVRENSCSVSEESTRLPSYTDWSIMQYRGY